MGGDRHRHPLRALVQDPGQEVGERLADPGRRFDRQDAARGQHIGNAAGHFELTGAMLESGPHGGEEARWAEQVVDVERWQESLAVRSGALNGRGRAV